MTPQEDVDFSMWLEFFKILLGNVIISSDQMNKNSVDAADRAAEYAVYVVQQKAKAAGR